MPAKARKIGNKYRVVHGNNKLVRNKSGGPVDGGGHKTRDKAVAQAAAINRKSK